MSTSLPSLGLGWSWGRSYSRGWCCRRRLLSSVISTTLLVVVVPISLVPSIGILFTDTTPGGRMQFIGTACTAEDEAMAVGQPYVATMIYTLSLWNTMFSISSSRSCQSKTTANTKRASYWSMAAMVGRRASKSSAICCTSQFVAGNNEFRFRCQSEQIPLKLGSSATSGTAGAGQFCATTSCLISRIA